MVGIFHKQCMFLMKRRTDISMFQQNQLILNPVENLPELFPLHWEHEAHGLYISDKHKTDQTNKVSKIAFSGREQYSQKIHDIYRRWATQLHVKHLSMRLLSGLHAHIILFMGLGKIGDTVLLLPEEAGGHYATKEILVRLGYSVIDMAADPVSLCVDMEETKKIMKQYEPQLIFVDRSEGIYYEDFSPLLKDKPQNCGAIFDASQYLTNILMEDLPSPFPMEFDIMMSTLHKNFPGPQKALVCSKNNNIYWERIQNSMSSYVSNLHAESIFIAGEILNYENILRQYSRQMLCNSIALEKLLLERGLPVVERDRSRPATHHIWINCNDSERAYSFYKRAECCGILFNYRKLPYHLGYGIRMGTSAATLQGVKEENIVELANILAEIYHASGITSTTIQKARNYICSLVPITMHETPDQTSCPFG